MRAQAEGGKANVAVINVLSRELGVPSQALELVSGAAAARKVIEVANLSEVELRQRLARINI